MISRLRRSFAAKLVIGGCLLALVVIGGVASYLIYSRTTQTRAAAQSNADNRAGVMAEVLDRFTGVESLNAATTLAAQPALRTALSGADPGRAVADLFGRNASVDLDGDVLLVSDGGGSLLFARPSPTVASGVSILTSPDAVAVALHGGRCSRGTNNPIAGSCGVEVLSGGGPAYIVAIPVVDGGRTLGVVAYAAPLSFQLDRFQALFNFPTAFISAQRTDTVLRPGTGGSAGTDPGLRAALRASAPTHRAIYDAPVGGGATGPVAGSFVPVYASSGALSGYIGVEVPLSQFVGDERTDVVAVALISVFVLLLVVLAVVLFVERFVKRPIARLEGGVARIADGDYATDMEVRSHDELGRLAANVNTMRDSIAGYVRQIEAARLQLDRALQQVGDVSRALTTTTAGVATLQQAVVRTAAAIGSSPRAAMLALREGELLVPSATAGDVPPLSEWPGAEAVLGGQTVRLEHPVHGDLVAVPMFYQDAVIGTLATVTPPGAGPATETDADVLSVLANNAAVAMENARLFVQERETVQRLLELDSLKTDFLGTIQHELRTPLTAIIGLADLLEMYWTMWADGPKLEAVGDIQLAAQNLYDIVETIIDYSAMQGDTVGLNPTSVPLRASILSATELVAARYKGGALPVPVDVEGDEDLTVFADPQRLLQVLRALLDNAVKFSDGRGRVTVSFARLGRRRDVRLTVTDEGIGIAPEDQPRIFERFFQADNTATRQHGGTGMGLALVKRMVDAHGARVSVDSVQGEGTRVTVVWPASPKAAAGEARAVAEEGARSGRNRRSRRRPTLPVQ